MGNRNNRDLYEISLSAKSDLPALAEILRHLWFDFGIKERDLVESRDRQGIHVATYTRSTRITTAAKRYFTRRRLGQIHCRIKSFNDIDWQNKWKKDIRPFALTKTFDVVPVWAKKYYKRGRKIPIYLNTTLAFGTGLHETTRFTARLIESCRGRFGDFLDIGTGTGLLSIVAMKSGARKAVAIDIDKNCIGVARANLAANGLAFETARAQDARKYSRRDGFDLVAANLFSQDLIQMRRKIVSLVRPGGFLVISGISLSHRRIVQERFRPLPLRCLRILKGRKWLAILYKRIV